MTREEMEAEFDIVKSKFDQRSMARYDELLPKIFEWTSADLANTKAVLESTEVQLRNSKARSIKNVCSALFV